MIEEWKSAKYYRTETGTVEELLEIEVSNLGNFRYAKNKKKIKIGISGGYSIIRYYKNKRQYKFSVHIIMASTFLETPNSPGYVVDHINRIKTCYNIDNLRFVTISENAKNSSPKNQNIIFINIKTNKIIDTRLITSLNRKKVNTKIRKDAKNWVSISVDMYDKYKNNLLSEINRMISENWVKISDNKFINNKGEIKSFKNNTKIPNFSFGNLNNSGYYVTSKVYSKYSNLVHRIVAQVFINNDNCLKNKIIDHINSDQRDNSVSNLRIVENQKENISNPSTLLKMSKQIKCTLMDESVIFFTSRNTCSKLLNIRKNTLTEYIKDNSKIRKVYPTIKSLEYINYRIPDNSIIDKFNITKISKSNINIKDYNSLEDINTFLKDNKIISRKDLIDKGYINLYWKIKYLKLTKLIKYYKPS